MSGLVSPAFVNLAVAHLPEAKPLLSALKLKQICYRPFPVFAGADGVQLIVTGNGKLAMATAVGYLQALQETGRSSPACWLNIGIAGHGEAALGSGLLIHKIQDRESGQVYYPTPLIDIAPASALVTGDVVEVQYLEAVAYDMEGSGFWQAATQFAGIDFVQLFKIVSDNPQHHVEHFDVGQIGTLISAQLEPICEVVEQLRELAANHANVHALPEASAEILSRWHFTRTQENQLQALLRRWRAHGLDAELVMLSRSAFSDARSVLQALEAGLQGEER